MSKEGSESGKRAVLHCSGGVTPHLPTAVSLDTLNWITKSTKLAAVSGSTTHTPTIDTPLNRRMNSHLMQPMTSRQSCATLEVDFQNGRSRLQLPMTQSFNRSARYPVLVVAMCVLEIRILHPYHRAETVIPTRGHGRECMVAEGHDHASDHDTSWLLPCYPSSYVALFHLLLCAETMCDGLVFQKASRRGDNIQ